MIIYMLAHDLRQPFASLISISDVVTLAGRNFTDDELRQIFEEVHYTSSVSIEILNGLLCFYKINKEGASFEHEAIVLHNMITEANSLYVPEQVNRNIAVYNNIPKNQLIYAPKEILQFVNRNILNNATKHSPAGGKIEVTCSKADGYLTVAFRDRGNGLSQQQLQMLFNITHLDSKYGANIKGAGIAMSICKDLIGRLNGRIWAKSIKSKGTVFYYSIPHPNFANED